MTDICTRPGRRSMPLFTVMIDEPAQQTMQFIRIDFCPPWRHLVANKNHHSEAGSNISCRSVIKLVNKGSNLMHSYTLLVTVSAFEHNEGQSI